MIRVAVMGAGARGQQWIGALAANPRVELVAVCDAYELTRAEILARYPDLIAIRGIDALLEVPAIDAIVVATPPHVHFDHAFAALDAGYHVLVETPLATSTCHARRLRDLATRDHLILMAGANQPFCPLLADAKRQIQRGAWGTVRTLRSRRSRPAGPRQCPDSLWGLVAHDLTAANFLLDDIPAEVSAQAGYPRRPGGPEMTPAVTRFEAVYAGGAILSGEASTAQDQVTGELELVTGAGNWVYAESATEVCLRSVRAGSRTVRPLASSDAGKSVELSDGPAAVVDAFVRRIATHTATDSATRAAGEVVCALEAMAQSMADGGATVRVDYRPMSVGPVAVRPAATL
jgi:predicted dehydrogenase